MPGFAELGVPQAPVLVLEPDELGHDGCGRCQPTTSAEVTPTAQIGGVARASAPCLVTFRRRPAGTSPE